MSSLTLISVVFSLMMSSVYPTLVLVRLLRVTPAYLITSLFIPQFLPFLIFLLLSNLLLYFLLLLQHHDKFLLILLLLLLKEVISKERS